MYLVIGFNNRKYQLVILWQVLNKYKDIELKIRNWTYFPLLLI